MKMGSVTAFRRALTWSVLSFALAGCSDEVLPATDASSTDAAMEAEAGKDAKWQDVVFPDGGDGSCTTPIDCPDIFGWVCDPATKKCTPDQCGPESGKTCKQDQVCVYQLGGTTAAACYPKCERFTQQMPCPMGQECVVGRGDGKRHALTGRQIEAALRREHGEHRGVIRNRFDAVGLAGLAVLVAHGDLEVAALAQRRGSRPAARRHPRQGAVQRPRRLAGIPIEQE